MTAEEVFCELSDKYGDDFNWHMLPLSNHTFTAELKKEIGNRHFLYHKQIWAVAKCDSNDDVLYLADNGEGTYSECNADGFPRYKEFEGINAVKEYIEQSI